MDNIRLFIDFGSTYTKVSAIDLDAVELIASAQVPSTVETDITIGLQQALAEIAGKAPVSDIEKREAVACSSAAGGLRMVCTGFVPDLTSKAANHAALGAGAKVIRCYSYKLTGKEIREIEAIAPDIVLLCGGTDGGDEKTILHNARMLADSSHTANILVAGNKTAYDEIEIIFNGTGKKIVFTSNVMPEIGVLDVAPCNREIREIFLKNIIKAKGIDKAESIVSGVIMPTPAAVLEAAKQMASGCGDEPGFGELVIIDPGGATTDVHSVATGKPSRGGAILRDSLPEPYVKRTVEGNLGLKHNLDTLKEFIRDKERVPQFEEITQRFCEGKLPCGEDEIACHLLLSRVAVEVAMRHHTGKIETVWGPSGEVILQSGKDLTTIKTVIGTGGPIIRSSNPRYVLEGALFSQDNPAVLAPNAPDLYLDKDYILYAVGLLSQSEPVKALRLARKHLRQI